MVMKLNEQGTLDLDRPLSHYYPEPPCNDPRAIKITARQVLSHTTGFPNWRDEGENGADQLRIHAEPEIRGFYSSPPASPGSVLVVLSPPLVRRVT